MLHNRVESPPTASCSGRGGTVHLTMFVYSTWPSPDARSAQRAAGFLGQEGYFWLTRVGSDVTSVSSSSGPGSSLDPEILLSFPVVLGEVEEVWRQQTRRGRAGEGRQGRQWQRWGSLSRPSPLTQWCFSR